VFGKETQDEIYYAKKGYLSIDNIAFPRIVKFKARAAAPRISIPNGLIKGRTYSDFLLFMAENELVEHVEMDSLVGRIGGKAILTLHFTFSNFMLGILLENLKHRGNAKNYPNQNFDAKKQTCLF